MSAKIIKNNSVPHGIPKDMLIMISGSRVLSDLWGDITPLAQNEWICWVISAKKEETRARRIAIMKSKMLAGDRRPCCWAGCPHR